MPCVENVGVVGGAHDAMTPVDQKPHARQQLIREARRGKQSHLYGERRAVDRAGDRAGR